MFVSHGSIICANNQLEDDTESFYARQNIMANKVNMLSYLFLVTKYKLLSILQFNLFLLRRYKKTDVIKNKPVLLKKK